MKLGILTFHRSINYGAFMQCYALSHEIMRRFPYLDVEVVDFEMLTKHQMYLPKKKGLMNFIQYNEKKTQYRRFQNDLKHLPLSKPALITNDYYKVFDYLNGNYDILVVGSDAVWAFNQKLGLPNPYFLFGNKLKCHKLSYAASAYSLDQTKLTQEEIDYIGECLQSFEYIGVRDEETKKLVNLCAPAKEVYRNCDPTVLLPIPSKEEGTDILKSLGIDTSKKVVSIMSRGTTYARIIKSYLGSKDFTFINLYIREQFRDAFSLNSPKFLYNLSPLEWYKIYAACSLNITTMFHGTLLALRSGVPTIAFDRTKLSSSYISKIQQILSDLKLHDCWFSNNVVDEVQERKVIACVNNLVENRDTISIAIQSALNLEKQKSESFFIKLDEIIRNAK